MENKILIDSVNNLKVALNEISVYDFDVYTSMELYYKIAENFNKVIKELNRFEGVVSDEVIKQNEKLLYLLGEGLKIEVVDKINEMVEKGVFDTIINHNIFNNLKEDIKNVSSQLEHMENKKANENEVVKKGQGTLNDFDEETRGLILGLSVGETNINAVLGEGNVKSENLGDKQVRPNKTTFISEKRNLFDKQIYVKGIVSSVNGSIIENDNFACSNFIRFEKGKTYNISGCYDYAFYNKDKTFVRGVEHTKAPLTLKSESDEEKYIMYTMDLSDVETNMMCENELPTEYIDGSFGKNGKITLSNELKEPIIELIKSQNIHKLNGKTWNVLGDSITEHNGATTKNYHDFIKEWTGCVVNNYGVSGTGYTETTSTPNNRFIQRVANMNSNADIVTVFGAINDFYFGTKILGKFGDKTSDTFYGAVDELILALINKFPTKTIAVFTPLISTLALNPNSKGETLNQYVDAIIEVCNYYAIPVLDLNKCSGLNPNVEVIKNNFIPDGTHPNASGHEKIAYIILSFLESLL